VSYIDFEKARVLSSFVPSRERYRFLEIVLEACGGNIYRSAKEIGISRSQLYRYLGRAKRRDVPSDEVLAKIIVAAYRLRPAKTRDVFRFLLNQFYALVSRL